MRWLHRFANAQLRREAERIRRQSQARLEVAGRLDRLLREARAIAETQTALTSRWRSIAHQRAQDNEALRQKKEQNQ